MAQAAPAASAQARDKAKKKAQSRKLSIDRVTKALAAGDLDDHLASVVNAASARLVESDQVLRWAISYDFGDGNVVRISDDDLTLEEAADACAFAKTNWGSMNPLHSPKDCLALLFVGLVHRCDLDRDDALATLKGVGMHDALDAITQYQAGRDPFESSAPETS